MSNIRTTLESLPVRELRELAAQMNISGRSSMRKEELVSSIASHPAAAFYLGMPEETEEAPEPVNARRVATPARRADYSRSFPAATPGEVVTQGHANWCRDHGHATHKVDGVTQIHCPRCGDLLPGQRGANFPAEPAIEETAKPVVEAGLNFNLDTQHKIRINHGFRTEDVTCLVGTGTCDYCGQTRIEVRNFDIEGVDEEEISSTLCRECIEDDPELELLGTFPTVPAQAEEPEAEEDSEPEAAKNIEERHCSMCGNTYDNDVLYDVNDGYSICCNEIVMEHGTYYPNGTNLPGVRETCENQGRCSHD
jgi:hypothetical protein